MKFRALLLILSISILAACGSDDAPTNKELEAAQAGVELLSESDIKTLSHRLVAFWVNIWGIIHTKHLIN